MWEEEGTLLYHVEANGSTVIRRADNDWINGTKLLNVTKMTRGRRDGILRGERLRKVVKVGSMHLKGVWIPFERARKIAEREKILDLLYPLFVKDIKSLFPLDTFAENFHLDHGNRLVYPNVAAPTPVSPVNLPPLSRISELSPNTSSFSAISAVPGGGDNHYQQQQQQQQQPTAPTFSSNTRTISAPVPTSSSSSPPPPRVPSTSTSTLISSRALNDKDSRTILTPPISSSSSSSAVTLGQRSTRIVELSPQQPNNATIPSKQRSTSSSSFSSVRTPVLPKAHNGGLFGSVKDGCYNRVVLPEPLKNTTSIASTVTTSAFYSADREEKQDRGYFR